MQTDKTIRRHRSLTEIWLVSQ